MPNSNEPMDLDLFIKKAVSQSREIKMQKRGQKKAVSGETQRLINESEEALARFRAAQLDLNWKDLAVVLMIHRVTCDKCGNVKEIPNGHIFLKRQNRYVGVHYRSINTELNKYSNLPNVKEYRDSTSPFCDDCFQETPVLSPKEKLFVKADRVIQDY